MEPAADISPIPGAKPHPPRVRPSLFEYFLASFKLGMVGFGGGVSVLALIRERFVSRKHWVTEREFTNAATVSQMLPGGASSNTLAYLGLRFHGWRGALTGYLGFILPGALAITGLAWVYKKFGAIPHADMFLAGLNAGVVGVIAAITFKMLRTSVARLWQMAVAAGALLLSLIGDASSLEVALLGIAAGLALDFGFEGARLWRYRRHRRREPEAPVALPDEGQSLPVHEHAPDDDERDEGETPRRRATDLRRDRAEDVERAGEKRGGRDARGGEEDRSADDELGSGSEKDLGPRTLHVWLVALLVPALAVGFSRGADLARMVMIFFRTGLGAYGGGFAIIPTLHSAMHDIGWLDEHQFADAVAVGKLTPGPVLLMATFIGFLRAGIPGAVAATFGIFAAPFLLVTVLGTWLDRMRSRRWVRAALRGLTPAVVGLMAAAALTLGQTFRTGAGVGIAAATALTLVRFDLNPVPLLFLAGAVRVLIHAYGG